jgi:hypothetical protein
VRLPCAQLLWCSQGDRLHAIAERAALHYSERLVLLPGAPTSRVPRRCAADRAPGAGVVHNDPAALLPPALLARLQQQRAALLAPSPPAVAAPAPGAPIRISLPMAAQKANFPYLRALRRVLRRAARPVHLRVFSNMDRGAHLAMALWARAVAQALGLGAAQVGGVGAAQKAASRATGRRCTGGCRGRAGCRG